MNINNNCTLITNVNELDKALKFNDKVIALVYASWCPYCVRFLPIFQHNALEMQKFLLVQDDQEIVADKYSVEVVPTVLFFQIGKVVKRLDGVLGVGLSEKQLVDFIKICIMVDR